MVGTGVVAAVEKKGNNCNIVREVLYHRNRQGTIKPQGRNGESIHISDRKQSLSVLLGARKNFLGDVILELGLEGSMGQPSSVS